MLVHLRTRRPAVDRALQRDVDDLFRAFGFDWPAPSAAPVAVSRDADGVTVRAELPGVDPANIAIGVEGRTLTITAERTPEQRQGGVHQLRERAYGTFKRTLRLSDDLDADAISAEAKHGVLTVRIPMRAEAKPRQIAVTAD
jgi:HSP20 family protein